MRSPNYRAAPLAVIGLCLSFATGCGDDDIFEEIGVGDEPSTDAEIAHVARTANTGEVDQAQIALPRLQTEEARAYAEQMVTEHTASNEELADLVNELGLDLQDNEVSEDLRERTEDVLSDLREAEASEVDAVYIQSQVISHRRVLETIDEDLLPEVESPELRSFLESMRATVASHLEEAQQLEGTLPGASSELPGG